MDFKAMMDSKAVITLADGSQQAAFQKDFFLDAKSMDHTVDANGDLWIEGYASDFGLDRQEEAFEPGAFERGLKAFLDVNPIMLFHHQYDKALGKFTEAYVDDKGLYVKGRVDAPAQGSWAEDVFNKIKRGTIKSFSVGGIFKRRGNRIYDVDLGEISITPFPVNPRTTFNVVAKKAFENADVKAPEGALEVLPDEIEGEVVEPVVEKTPEELALETVAAAKLEEEAAAAAKAEEDAKLPPIDVTPGSITGEYIAPGSVSTEHLSDELRSRVAEFRPEAPSVESAHQRLGDLASKLDSLFDHIGIREDGTDARIPQVG